MMRIGQVEFRRVNHRWVSNIGWTIVYETKFARWVVRDDQLRCRGVYEDLPSAALTAERRHLPFVPADDVDVLSV